MAHSTNYLQALREAIGDEKFSLALEHLALVKKFLTKTKRQELTHAHTLEDRKKLLDEWFAGFLADEVKNFIVLLASQNQLSFLDTISDTAKAVLPITITTAAPLSPELKNWFRTKIEPLYPKNPVTFQEDEEILGGITIRIGDSQVDNSLKTKLNVLIHSV